MKKLLAGAFLLYAANTYAMSITTPSYLEEMQALGTVSGMGMACGAPKYATFEMLARAILLTKAVSDENQAEGMLAYNTAKADAFLAKQADGLYNCAEINARFNDQKIFKTILYGDGTIKMYDGTIYYPRSAYDATLLKDDENLNYHDALDIYREAKNKNKNNKKSARSEDGTYLVPQKAGKLPSAANNHSAPLTSQAVRASEFGGDSNGGIKHISNKRR